MKTLLTITILTISSLTFGNSKFEYCYSIQGSIRSLYQADTQPTLEKGMESLYKKWKSLVKYPLDAKKNKIEGTVFISLMIDENGDLVEPIVLKGLGYGCDEAAVEALSKTKLKWTPGTISGKIAKMKMVMPFSFKLN